MRGRGRFVGIGLGTYDDPALVDLAHAAADVEKVAGLLSTEFEGEPLFDVPGATIVEHLNGVPGSLPDGGPLILLWSGHGELAPSGDVALLPRDARRDRPTTGLLIAQVVGPCADSGTSQMLVVVDTCFSGGAVHPAVGIASSVMRSATATHPAWAGVLASSAPGETAVDGRLGAALVRLLERGPELPELRLRWSPFNARISGQDLMEAVAREWDVDDDRPEIETWGCPLPMFPNPLYDPGAPAIPVDEAWQGSGVSAIPDRAVLAGRVAEVGTVVEWVRAARSGLFVVTGSPGTGKSAIVDRVVGLSRRSERQRLLAEDITHPDPGLASVQALVRPRGESVEDLAEAIDAELTTNGYLRDPGHRRSLVSLLAAVESVRRSAGSPPVVVVDGLDRDGDAAVDVAIRLLAPLSRYATVIVTTRRATPSGGDLAAVLPAAAVVDLDEPRSRDGLWQALLEFVRGRWTR